MLVLTVSVSLGDAFDFREFRLDFARFHAINFHVNRERIYMRQCENSSSCCNPDVTIFLGHQATP